MFRCRALGTTVAPHGTQKSPGRRGVAAAGAVGAVALPLSDKRKKTGDTGGIPPC